MLELKHTITDLTKITENLSSGITIYLTGMEAMFIQKFSILVIASIKSETSIGFVM